MAQVVSGNQVRLNNGQVITGKQGEWYDSQQFWNNSLSNPGQINKNSNQQGAGQQVSNAVIAQTNPNNVAYVQQQQQKQPLQNDTGNPAFGGGVGTPGGGGGIGITPAPPTLNLPDLYTSLEKSSGISGLQDQLTKAQQDFNTASSTINDNPFLSEGDRTGRQAKLQNDFNNNTKTLQDSLSMKQADVKTQLDLATQQFNINSETAKAAMDQFNTLLSSGALDNASGSDIAALTQQTGMSSNMIQSAITASKAKNQQTSVISFDDGTNQGFAVIDPKTGAIINKQIIAGSKPTTKGTGDGTGLTPAEEKQQNQANLDQSIKNGVTLKSLVQAFGPALGDSYILQRYNSGLSPWGKARETLADVTAGKYKD